MDLATCNESWLDTPTKGNTWKCQKQSDGEAWALSELDPSTRGRVVSRTGLEVLKTRARFLEGILGQVEIFMDKAELHLMRMTCFPLAVLHLRIRARQIC